MTITIRSRREGFIRCGIRHTVAAKEYPNDRFSAAELDRLMADPMLVVFVTQGEDETEVFKPEDIADPAKMSFAELKKLAKDMGLQTPRNIKQAELLQMVNDEFARAHKADMDELDKLAGVSDPAAGQDEKAETGTGDPADPAAGQDEKTETGTGDAGDPPGEPKTE